VTDPSRVRDGLSASVVGAHGAQEAADRLCEACVELLDIDGAAVSVIHQGAISRSLAASSSLSRELDELQFTLGEGPCLQSVAQSAPVLVADLDEQAGAHWPGFAAAAARRGVRAVFAIPITVITFPVGALDLYRNTPGALAPNSLSGGLLAAELAAVPLLDLLGMDFDAAVSDESSSAWDRLSSITRVEVYQAAGMLVAQLGITPSEAILRLRGYAFAHDRTASQVAYDILERRLRLDDDRDGHSWGDDTPEVQS
jgi:hypothetical protein